MKDNCVEAIRQSENLVDFAFAASEAFSQLPAFSIAGNPDAQLTYGQLGPRIAGCAKLLGETGLKPGTPVLLAVNSCPDWSVAFFGILAAGGIVVPFAPEMDANVARVMMRHAGIRFSVCSRNIADAIYGNEDLQSDSRCCLLVEDIQSSDEKKPPPEGGLSHQPALIAFTSGSTDAPRAVVLSHGNLLSNMRGLMRIRGGQQGDAMLSVLPPAHLFELVVGLLAPLSCGAHVVYSGPPLPNRLVRYFSEYQITHALAVPALVECLYQEVLSQLIDKGLVAAERQSQTTMAVQDMVNEMAEPDLQELVASIRRTVGDTFRTLVVGGAALDPHLAELIARVGFEVEVGYGLTEAGPIVSVGTIGDCPRGSVGRSLPGVEVRIGDCQEICVRSSSAMIGYFGNQEASVQAFDDGWLRTGDCGTIDADGFIFVTGRLKEAIVSADGRTTYPDEIEPHYRSQLFAEACVAACADKQVNDVATLYVVPVDPEVGDEQLQAEVRRLSIAAPAGYRVSKTVRLQQPLPRTSTGKVRRRMLTGAGGANGREL